MHDFWYGFFFVVGSFLLTLPIMFVIACVLASVVA